MWTTETMQWGRTDVQITQSDQDSVFHVPPPPKQLRTFSKFYDLDKIRISNTIQNKNGLRIFKISGHLSKKIRQWPMAMEQEHCLEEYDE